MLLVFGIMLEKTPHCPLGKAGSLVQENYILLENKQLKDLNPVQCGSQRCEPGHFFGPAVRDHFLLHYVVSGQGVFKTGAHTYSVKAGSIFVIRPNESTYYAADPADPWYYQWIGFTCMPQLAELLAEDVFILPLAGPVFSAMAGCHNLAHSRELFLCGKLYEFFALLSNHLSPTYTSEDSIRQAINYLDAEYVKDISIAELAKALHLNRSHFSVLFKNYTGQSPQQYLTHLRLDRAIELMRSKQFSASEAAVAVGYGDVYVFSRVFKQNYGCSPRRYILEQR